MSKENPKMSLHVTPRNGGKIKWDRGITITFQDGSEKSIGMAMDTVDGKRVGFIADKDGNELWLGEIPNKGTPFNAFCVAVGLWDNELKSDINPPEWLT